MRGLIRESCQSTADSDRRVGSLAMSVPQFVLGVACLVTVASMLTRREAIVARRRKRSAIDTADAPETYAVVGGIVGLAGVVFILAALL